ncbi:MAG: hypothetical protein ACI8X5_001279 [Planctomycetota bacterium]|jgi:hypothetical protein
MRMRVVLSAGLVAIALTGCFEPPVSDAQTVLVCVWDGVDLDELHAYGAAYDSTPVLSAISQEAASAERVFPQSQSSSAAFASLLTGAAPEKHGLRSVRELGASRLSADQETLAEGLQKQGWRTLASVSQGHFTICGLSRGFDEWFAPALDHPGRVRAARDVASALQPSLAKALASEADVFAVMHFGDLRGRGKGNVEPSEELLAAFLSEWRGTGGVIDEAFADKDSEQSLASRLSSVLLRRADDPRKAAMQGAIYAARLGALDVELGALRAALVKSGRTAKATLIVAGSPGDSEEVPFVRWGSSSILDGWTAARKSRIAGANTPRTRAVNVKLTKPRFDGLKVTLKTSDGALAEVGDKEHSERGEFELSAGEFDSLNLIGNSGAFTLRLEHTELFGLSFEWMAIGGQNFEQADVPFLLAPKSEDWPKNTLTGPLLDLQSIGGRRMSGKFSTKPNQRIELLVELFPADLEFANGIKVESGGITPHEFRPGAVWLRGSGYMEFELPPRSPSSRLGLVLRVDGKRIVNTRIRYLKRIFGNPDTRELGISSGVWLDPDLVGAGKHLFEPQLSIVLLDDLPASGSNPGLTPAEYEYLSQLSDNE